MKNNNNKTKNIAADVLQGLVESREEEKEDTPSLSSSSDELEEEAADQLLQQLVPISPPPPPIHAIIPTDISREHSHTTTNFSSTTPFFPIKEPILAHHTTNPVWYWTLQHQKKWIVFLKEQPDLTFSVQIEANQIIVFWSMVAPKHLLTQLGISSDTAKMHNVHGTQLIHAPVPLITNANFITKQVITNWRVLEIPIALVETKILF